MKKRDLRKWLKVYPRGFANEYFFLGFDSAEKREEVKNNYNNDVNSSAENVYKKEVKDVENYRDINGQGVYTLEK